MSRSYKKTPIAKDNKRGRKYFKRLANKKVRKTKNISNGKEYKKVFNTWDIYDYVSYCTLEEFEDMCVGRMFKTKEEAKEYWRRVYYNK